MNELVYAFIILAGASVMLVSAWFFRVLPRYERLLSFMFYVGWALAVGGASVLLARTLMTMGGN